MRTLLGAVLLAFQIGMIVYARFVPSRYFCWAPMDSQNLFSVRVVINGRELSTDEIVSRYRQPQQGGNWQSIQHVKDKLQQYEETYGRTDNAKVEMTYTVNDGKEQFWEWPQR